MTAKVYIENKLVKTVYYQTNKLKPETISLKLAKLRKDIYSIGLPFTIQIVGNRRNTQPRKNILD